MHADEKIMEIKYPLTERRHTCEVRRLKEPRLAERGVRFSDVGDPSASTPPVAKLGRFMLLELFLQQQCIHGSWMSSGDAKRRWDMTWAQ